MTATGVRNSTRLSGAFLAFAAVQFLNRLVGELLFYRWLMFFSLAGTFEQKPVVVVDLVGRLSQIPLASIVLIF